MFFSFCSLSLFLISSVTCLWVFMSVNFIFRQFWIVFGGLVVWLYIYKRWLHLLMFSDSIKVTPSFIVTIKPQLFSLIHLRILFFLFFLFQFFYSPVLICFSSQIKWFKLRASSERMIKVKKKIQNLIIEWTKPK